jgi:hypothetical protein
MLNSHRKALFVLAAKVQFHFRVDAVDAFMIVKKAHGSQTMVHHPEAPAAMQISHLPELLPDGLIVFWLGFVANNRWVGAKQVAGPTKTH